MGMAEIVEDLLDIRSCGSVLRVPPLIMNDRARIIKGGPENITIRSMNNMGTSIPDMNIIGHIGDTVCRQCIRHLVFRTVSRCIW